MRLMNELVAMLCGRGLWLLPWTALPLGGAWPLVILWTAGFRTCLWSSALGPLSWCYHPPGPREVSLDIVCQCQTPSTCHLSSPVILQVPFPALRIPNIPPSSRLTKTLGGTCHWAIVTFWGAEVLVGPGPGMLFPRARLCVTHSYAQ